MQKKALPRQEHDDVGEQRLAEIELGEADLADGRAGSTDPVVGKRLPAFAAIGIVQPARIGRLGEQCDTVCLKGAD